MEKQCTRWEELDQTALEAVQELHKLSESHPENQRIIGRNRLVLEGVVHVLQNGSAKSKLWCCAVLVNLAYRSEENTAKIGVVLFTANTLLTHPVCYSANFAGMHSILCSFRLPLFFARFLFLSCLGLASCVPLLIYQHKCRECQRYFVGVAEGPENTGNRAYTSGPLSAGDACEKVDSCRARLEA